MRRWFWVLVAAFVLAVGCSDDEEQSSGTTTSTTPAVSSSTVEVTSTTTPPVPTTVPAGCRDGPPPPVPYQAGDDYDGFLEGVKRGDCYHFWGVVETTNRFPYQGDDFGCSADFTYGTTPPMIDEVQSIHMGSNQTKDCRDLLTVKPGDTVEVWTSLAGSDMGFGLWFKGVRVHDAE